MQHFTSIYDVPDLTGLLNTARAAKANPLQWRTAGDGKTLGLIFFNASLRTRLSTQKAARNLGLEVIVMNIGDEGWKLEFQDGVVMNADKAEHIKDAAAVIGEYCDIIGIRTFPGLKDREADYREEVLGAFMKYSGRPIVSLESATRHPLQSLADWLTIEEHKKRDRPKVVLTWAPHPRALPQAVGNSFVEWMSRLDVELVVTHPEGYELAPEFIGDTRVEYDWKKAYEGADFVYAKNWSSYQQYGQILRTDDEWQVNAEKMALTRQACFMHCLPVRRNVVVADEVIDSPESLVITEAGNRVYSAQAVLKTLLDHI